MNTTPPSSYPLALVALVAGTLGGGLVVTAAALLRPTVTSRAAIAGEVAIQRDTEAPATLGLRMEAIESRLAVLELAPPVALAQPVGRIEQPKGSAEWDTAGARLAEIEAVLSKLTSAEERRVEEVAERVLRREMRDLEREERAVLARATILDPRGTEEAKLEAWGELRGGGTWGDAIVNEMIRIGEASENEETRADVWRQAHGADRNTLLVRPLLSALSSDTSERVRSEAAETLQDYKGEPGVEQALIYAAEHDPSEEVREEAQSSLNGS